VGRKLDMSCQKIGDKKIQKLVRQTGLPIISAFANGAGSNHSVYVIIDDGRKFTITKEGEIIDNQKEEEKFNAFISMPRDMVQRCFDKETLKKTFDAAFNDESNRVRRINFEDADYFYECVISYNRIAK
jgi:hypothetical protein